MLRLLGSLLGCCVLTTVAFAGAIEFCSDWPCPAPSELSQPEKAKSDTRDQPAEAYQGGTKDAPFAVEIVPSKKTKTEAKQDRKDRKNRAANERALVIFNGLLVLFNGLLVLVTAGLVVYTRKLWSATDKLVREAKETAQQELRAYVFLKSPRIDSVAALEWPEATIPIRNFGKTPAYKMTAEFAIGYGPFPLPKGYKPDLPRAKEVSRSDLAPGAKATSTVEKEEALTSPQLEAIIAGKAALYVAGFITYTDAFEDRWVTTIRMQYTHRSAAKGDGSLEVCEEGNETQKV